MGYTISTYIIIIVYIVNENSSGCRDPFLNLVYHTPTLMYEKNIPLWPFNVLFHIIVICNK